MQQKRDVTARFFILLLPFITAVISSTAIADDKNFVWWEAEETARDNFPPAGQHAFTPQNAEQAGKLSNGAWLGTARDGRETLFAEYRITVPEDGTYDFYCRKFWKHGPFRWRIDGGEGHRVGKDVRLLDASRLRKHVVANWVFLEEVKLRKGSHTLRIELLENTGAACFDAFLLTKMPFTARGKLKPGEQTNRHEQGFFAWEPPMDPLTDESPIDLRHLNESVAGRDGFVRRDGNRFRLGDGDPVRFWAVQNGGLGKNAKFYDRNARRLAKYGVNLVRLGGGKLFQSWRQNRERFRSHLDRLHRQVAALKEQGIYTYVDHLFWHTHVKITEDIFPGFGDGQKPIALLFFSKQFQRTYLDFLDDLMTTENPYTGTPMANDPAVAFLEIQNESGMLFWTFKPEQFPDTERARVERHFGNWLKDKYGSLRKARRAWGQESNPGTHTPDRFSEGRAGLYPAGFLTGAKWARNQRNPKRASDQLQFMVERQKAFYASMKKRLRDRGVRQLIVGSNWKTADARVLGALERYTYTGADVVCRNSYFGTEYRENGQQRFYKVEKGDTYRSRSALRPPASPAPLTNPQIAGSPYMITENSWTRPNRYRSEWPFLVGTYGRMSGLDGWTFFAMGTGEWTHRMDVWDLKNPSVLGQFPATALMFRRGDVTEPATPAVHERISFEEVFSFSGTKVFPIRGEDALWRERIGGNEGRQSTGGPAAVDHRAFFVGPVLQSFHDGPSELTSVSLDRYIDPASNRVESRTGELVWKSRPGVVTVNTPTAQGATGFLEDAGSIELRDVTIEVENRYASIIVIALDGRPIPKSDQILIQAGTFDKPYGYDTTSAGKYRKITDLGGYPLNVRRIRARVSLDGVSGEAIVLDGAGYPTDRRAETSGTGNTLTVTLPENALYTIIR